MCLFMGVGAFPRKLSVFFCLYGSLYLGYVAKKGPD